MAAATTTLTVTSTTEDQKTLTVFGTLTWSASPATYTAGGNVMSFLGFDDIKSGSLPLWVDVVSAKTAGGLNLYIYSYSPGTTQGNGTLQIFTGAAAQTALTELTNGAAIPSGVSGDTIIFKAIFPRL
jgi:hypothetical protein